MQDLKLLVGIFPKLMLKKKLILFLLNINVFMMSQIIPKNNGGDTLIKGGLRLLRQTLINIY